MNIKNRLNKLQNQIIEGNSGFCRCEKEIETIVIIHAADGGKTTLSGEPVPETTDAPEFCETCGRPEPNPILASFAIKVREEAL